MLSVLIRYYLGLLSRYEVPLFSNVLLKDECMSNSVFSLLLFLNTLFLSPRFDVSVTYLRSFFIGMGIGLAFRESYEFLIGFLYDGWANVLFSYTFGTSIDSCIDDPPPNWLVEFLINSKVYWLKLFLKPFDYYYITFCFNLLLVSWSFLTMSANLMIFYSFTKCLSLVCIKEAYCFEPGNIDGELLASALKLLMFGFL